MDSAAAAEIAAADLVRRLSAVPRQTLSVSRSRYRVVTKAAQALGWRVCQEESDDASCSMAWLDRWVPSDTANLSLTKLSHFPAMNMLGTKCSLARALNRMRAEFPDEYAFHPISFVLPHDREKLAAFASAFAAEAARARRQGQAARPTGDRACTWDAASQPQPSPGQDTLTFICKPDTGSRGNGITLVQTLEEVEEVVRVAAESGGASARAWASGAAAAAPAAEIVAGEPPVGPEPELTMVQVYLPRPLLMDGRKFDLRVYALVTSVCPTLRVFIYRQGLARFATEAYESPCPNNLAARKMFLTNYAVNRPEEAAAGSRAGEAELPPPAGPARDRGSALWLQVDPGRHAALPQRAGRGCGSAVGGHLRVHRKGAPGRAA